jgi:4-amino-4-deoxy-L-arabinose transferase-like glycosyltransferase
MTRTSKLAITLSIFAVVARLILIDQPYIDHWSWRQSDVAAIARNFFEHGFHFAYPQIDWAGDTPGYVGTEFPILPFVAAICYKLAGVHEWIGRVQAVVFFAASLPCFFLLVREIFGGTAAIWATLFYSFAPLNLFAGRSFMPDVPSLSLALIGLYFFLRWINSERSTSLFAAAIAISLALLIKLPSAAVGTPLLFLVWQKWRWNFLRRPSLWLFAAITILPSIAWYWHAHQIAEKFYPHHFFGAGGIRIENFSWYWKIVRLTAISSLTPVLSILATVGLFVTPRGKYTRVFHWWLAAMILFIIVVGYGNRHPWYQLPLVPIAAALAGVACAFIGSKIASRGAVITLIDSLPARQRFALPVYVARLPPAPLSILLASSFSILACLYVRPLYRSSSVELRDAGVELRKITARDSLIIAADNSDPTVFYYAERRGWHFLEKEGIYDGNPSDSHQIIVDLEQLRGCGATHLVFTTNTFWWLEYYPEFARHLAESATLLQATPQFRIYRLTDTTR